MKINSTKVGKYCWKFKLLSIRCGTGKSEIITMIIPIAQYTNSKILTILLIFGFIENTPNNVKKIPNNKKQILWLKIKSWLVYA